MHRICRRIETFWMICFVFRNIYTDQNQISKKKKQKKNKKKKQKKQQTNNATLIMAKKYEYECHMFVKLPHCVKCAFKSTYVSYLYLDIK